MTARSLVRSACRAASLAVGLVAAGCVVGGVGPGAEPAETAPGEIAFELAGPGEMAIVVPIRIDGRGPYPFIVDTGATFTCVDQALAEELELEDLPGTVGVGTGIGGGGALRIVRIESIEVGTARATGIPAAVIDLGNFKSTGVDVRGLLGLNVLKNYRVTFDFERRAMRLDAPGT